MWCDESCSSGNPTRRVAMKHAVKSVMTATAVAGLCDGSVAKAQFGSQRPAALRSSFRTSPTPRVVELCSPIRQRLGQHENLSFGNLLHWLRIFGRSPRRAAPLAPAARAVISDLTDAERLQRRFAAPSSLVASPDGLRYLVVGPNKQAHQAGRGTHAYQTLAVLGEIGMGCDTRVAAANRVGTIGDLLRDCTQNFQLREVRGVEPEWAITAIALYMHAATSWSNRWGEKLNFDDLAHYLADRPLIQSACLGTHALYCQAVLLRLHRDHGLLSKSTAARLTGICSALGRRIVASQASDGSWAGDWSGEPPPGSEVWYPIHVTGHLMECQGVLPLDLQIPAENQARAIRFLSDAVLNASEKAISDAYCPYSHAGRVILDLADQGEQLYGNY